MVYGEPRANKESFRANVFCTPLNASRGGDDFPAPRWAIPLTRLLNTAKAMAGNSS